MEADAASFAQELSASIVQKGSRCATSSPVEKRCSGLELSIRGATSTSTTAAPLRTPNEVGLELRPLPKETLDESASSAPLSLAEALERLSTAEREFSLFQSFLANHQHADGTERKCGIRAKLRLLDSEVDEAKRVCRAMALAQPRAGVREQLEKVGVQLATARRQLDSQLPGVGTSATARESLFCKSKTYHVRLGNPQSGNNSRDCTIAKLKQSQAVDPDPMASTTPRGPSSTEAIEQSPANMPQRRFAPAAGRAEKTRSSLRRWTNRRLTKKPIRGGNTADFSHEVHHTQAVVHAVSWPSDMHVADTSNRSLSSAPPLSQPTETNTESAGAAARAQTLSAVGGGRTGSSTPAIGSEPHANAELQVETQPEAEPTEETRVNAREVQPVSTEDDSLANGRRRGLWCNLLCCCAPRKNRGPRDPSKLPKSRPQAQKKRGKKAAATTTGGQKIGAGSSPDPDGLTRDAGNEQIDHARQTD